MKAIIKIFKALFMILFYFLSSVSAGELEIIYPTEGDTIEAAHIDSNYVFGHLFPPDSRLLINGHETTILDNGAFLNFLPIERGDFTYHFQMITDDDTLVMHRQVYFSQPAHGLSKRTFKIDSTTLKPAVDYVMQPGDVLYFEFRATPGCKAWCTIDGVNAKIPMIPAKAENGMYWGEAVFGKGSMRPTVFDSCLYRGSYVLQPEDSCRNSIVHFVLVNDAGDTASVDAAGRISSLKSGVPQIAETALDITVLRTGPRESYYYFLPKGVRLKVTGKIGDSYRIDLAKNHQAWVEEYKLSMLPQGSAVQPRNVQLVRTFLEEQSESVRVYTGAKVPFRIQQNSSPQSLTIYFYGITADTDWIRYDFKGTLIGEISWRQENDDVYAVDIQLIQKHQWGFDPYYDENDNFVLAIKKTPRVGRRRRTALKNVKILLDPGHHPDTGFVGPSGYEEREANLQLSEVLAKKLRKRGAVVSFTRQGEGVSLGERMRFAMNADADILLSLHHNAVPAGVNPFKNRGTSTYYYHTQSYELAKSIHRELLDELGLHDHGFYWDNLAMCRPTQMPAVLVEPAFMLHPEEEKLVKTDEYREKCANAIVRALQNFMTEFGNN